MYVLPPPDAVMVSGYTPSGVVVEVATVSIDWKVGLLHEGMKDPVAPGGSPLRLSQTVVLEPLVNVAVIVYVVCWPGLTDSLGGVAERLKSNGAIT